LGGDVIGLKISISKPHPAKKMTLVLFVELSYPRYLGLAILSSPI